MTQVNFFFSHSAESIFFLVLLSILPSHHPYCIYILETKGRAHQVKLIKSTIRFFTMSHVQDVIVCLFLTISLFSMGTIQARFLGNETDRQALLAFKRSISKDPQGVLSSWNDSLHFCQWEGVTCNGRHRQRVTILEFLSRGLAGTVENMK